MLKKNKIEIIVILDNIRSMHNIGSIFRTCDAIGDCKIYLCGICAQPPNKQIYKTALGATESVEWKYFAHINDGLKSVQKQGYQIRVSDLAQKKLSAQQNMPQIRSTLSIMSTEHKQKHVRSKSTT